jgi:hypothetical protein
MSLENKADKTLKKANAAEKNKTPTERVQRMVDILLRDFPEGVSMSNVSEIVIHSMRLVGEIPTLDGNSKKQLVVETVDAFVDLHDAGTYDEQIDGIVKFIVPKLIDQLILVENGKLKFKKKGFSWLSVCCVPGSLCNKDGNCCNGRFKPK